MHNREHWLFEASTESSISNSMRDLPAGALPRYWRAVDGAVFLDGPVLEVRLNARRVAGSHNRPHIWPGTTYCRTNAFELAAQLTYTAHGHL